MYADADATARSRRSTLVGTVTTDPAPMEMLVLQPFWFVLVTFLLVLEAIPPLPRTVMAATVCGVLAAAGCVHTAARSRSRPIARIAGRLAPVRWRTGMRLGITDDAGTRWILHFLPWFGHDLHLGDPAFAEGHSRHGGEFRALSLTNIRTGSRHISRWAMASITAATCTVVVILLIASPTG
ncbi:hypothetical protein [Nocardia crassostreae]|uniref:hypothetical protein n=1 Tax=Nocardia crassostreae TaxID=53428 RepID=UPI000836489D|nr:hypothetical protein [Nocardia crassostreae]